MNSSKNSRSIVWHRSIERRQAGRQTQRGGCSKDDDGSERKREGEKEDEKTKGEDKGEGNERTKERSGARDRATAKQQAGTKQEQPQLVSPIPLSDRSPAPVCVCVHLTGIHTRAHTHIHTHMHSTIHPIATVSATASDAQTTTHFDFSPVHLVVHLVDTLSRDATYTLSHTHTYHNRNMYSSHHSHHLHTSIVVVVVIAASPHYFLDQPTNVRLCRKISI